MKQTPVQKHMVSQQVSNSSDFPLVGWGKAQPANSWLRKSAVSVQFGEPSKGKRPQGKHEPADKQELPSSRFKLESYSAHPEDGICPDTLNLLYCGGRDSGS